MARSASAQQRSLFLPADHQKSRELKYASALSFVIALRMMGLFLLLPVFMVLAVDVPGYTPQLAGLAVGIYGLTQAVLQQPFGWVSDRLGRKPVLLFGLALFAAGGALAATGETMLALIAGRALQGCGAIAGVAMALAADVTRPERRSIAMAVIGIGIGASFLLSMMLSVPLSIPLGLHGMFWLTAAFAVTGMVVVALLPAAPRLAAEFEPGSAPDMRPVWVLAFSVFLLHAVMTLLFVTFPPLLVGKLGLELQSHWKLYVPTMLVSVLIVFPALRRIGARLSEHRYLHWGFLALAGTTALLPYSPPWLALGAVLTVYFIGFNLLEAGMPAVLSRVTGARGRGRKMGVYSTFQFLGAFLGGVAGGALLAGFGSGGALLAAGAVCLLWGVLLMYVFKGVFPTGEAV